MLKVESSCAKFTENGNKSSSSESSDTTFHSQNYEANARPILEATIISSLLEETLDRLHILSKFDVADNVGEDYRSSAKQLYNKYVAATIFNKVTLKPMSTLQDNQRTKIQKDRTFMQVILDQTRSQLVQETTHLPLTEAVFYHHRREKGKRNIMQKQYYCANARRCINKKMIEEEIEGVQKLVNKDTEIVRLEHQVHDEEILYHCKMRFNDNHCNALYEQNKRMKDNMEKSLISQIKNTRKLIYEENVINYDIVTYLTNVTNQCMEKVMYHCDNYDDMIEGLDNALMKRRTDMENLLSKLIELKVTFDVRSFDMKDHREHLEEVEDFKRKTTAAVALQSWFRGLYFRNGYMQKPKGKKGKDKG